MIVQIRNFDDEEIQALMASTGKKTASAAFGAAAHQYDFLRFKVENQAQIISSMRSRISHLESVIESARFAAAALVDKTSQQDLDV